jgi:hypothetical protein
MECRVPVAGYRVQVTGYRVPVAGYRVQVTGYRVPVAGYRVPVKTELRNWLTHQLVNSSTGQLINWSTHQLVNSSTGQLVNLLTLSSLSTLSPPSTYHPFLLLINS